MDLKYSDIGRRIRTIRKQKGLSQEQLAEMIDMSTVHVSHIETANTKFSLPTLINIANALNVSTDMLLCDSLESAEAVFRAEIADVVRDCSDIELRVIADTILALKQSLRSRHRI